MHYLIPRRSIALLAIAAIAAPTVGAQQQAPYFPGEETPISSAFSGITGDFDGDGITDALIGCTFEVQFARGDGFGAFKLGVTVPNSPGLMSNMVAADIDSDGVVDVIGVCAVPGNFVVVMKGHGDGTFSPSIVPVGTGTPRRIALGDLNADGHLDLVITKLFQLTEVRFGDGTGAFGPATLVGTATDALAALVFDATGDGANDLVLGDPAGIVICANVGGGVLAAPVVVPLVGDAEALAHGDLDGDGRDDLVALTANSTALCTLLGQGTGLVVSNVEAVTGLWLPTLGDLDADGDLDLVLNDDKLGVLVRRNDGSSAFAAAEAVGGLLSTVGVGIADVDGDALADIVSVKAGGSVGALRGQPDGSFVGNAPGVAIHPTPADSADVKFVATLCDADGDAKQDLAGTLMTTTGMVVATYKGNGAGDFGPAVLSPGADDTITLVAGDLNGDGRDDLVLAELAHVVVRLAAANGSYGAPNAFVFAGVNAPTDVALADFDLDGDLDIAVATPNAKVVARLQNTNGAFAAMAPAPIDGFFRPLMIRTADANADGADDMVAVANVPGSLMAVLRSDGAGGSSVTQLFSMSFAFGAADVVAGDVDSDGRVDLVAMASNEAQTYLGQAGGDLAESPVFGTSVGVSGTRTTALADLDGDGRADLAGSDVGLDVARGHGDGTFDAVREFLGHGEGGRVHVADLDADNRLDVVMSGRLGLNDAMASVFTQSCMAASGTFGNGCPGAGGFVPKIGIDGCASPGSTVSFAIRDGLGGSLVAILIGTATAHGPIGGGCFLEIGGLLPSAIVLPLPGAGPGAGDLTFPVAIPVGVAGTVHMQGFVADATSGTGYAASPRRTLIVQ